MPTVQTEKITLRVESSLKAKARRAAQLRGITVSALFGDLVSSLPDDTPPLDLSDAPLTARALRLSGGKVKIPENWDYRDELRDILVKKYL